MALDPGYGDNSLDAMNARLAAALHLAGAASAPSGGAMPSTPMPYLSPGPGAPGARRIPSPLPMPYLSPGPGAPPPRNVPIAPPMPHLFPVPVNPAPVTSPRFRFGFRSVPPSTAPNLFPASTRRYGLAPTSY